MTPALVLAALLSLSPRPAAHPLPGWAETPEQHHARLTSIAADIVAAVEEACASKAPSCARWAAPALIGVSWHESRWDPDVDAGRCYRGGGFRLRCDGGRAWTIFQLIGSEEEGRAWAADRKLASHEALRRLTRSWNACRRLAPELRWSIYARGRCTDPDGQRLSRELDAAIVRARAAMPMVE